MLPKVLQFTQMKMLPEELYGATQDEMTLNERRKYLKRLWPRYIQADKKGRGALLTEMEQVTGMHRKSITRLMRSAHQGSLERKKRKTKRSPTYGKEVGQVVSVVWESLDYICAERVQPQLLSTARHLAQFGELDKIGITLTPQLEEQLAGVSRPTVQRMISKLRSLNTALCLPRRGPERANRKNSATRGVPMGRIPWQTQEAGHFEVDLVHHCGQSTQGEYAHTLQMVDAATGWSERVVVHGRGQRAMEEGFRRIQGRVPFQIKELHPDNGPEFFNDHMVRFWGEELTGLRLSRSRPYHKNDNRWVEQKNDTLVRAYLGNGRLDTGVQVAALNELYDLMWVYYNLFQPVLHLSEKHYLQEEGKMKRRWDTARTPYERLKQTGALSSEQQEKLDRLHAQTNPRQLRNEIYERLAELWKCQEHTQALPEAERAA
jgi:hypothetical protein